MLQEITYAVIYLLYDNVFIDNFISFGINCVEQYSCPLIEKKTYQHEFPLIYRLSIWQLYVRAIFMQYFKFLL